MAIQPILQLGDPRLFALASKVDDFNQPELDSLIEDMFDTMNDADGAGLAAPQIGVGLRIVIFGFDNNPRYPDSNGVPKSILINPTITALSNEKEDDWEGCLSVPGMRGQVSRYKHIHYSGFDAGGNAIEVDASGFHARVVIIYTQRLSDPLKFGFTETLMNSGQLALAGCTE